MKIVNKHIDKISDLCRNHKVETLYLFGSSVSGNLSESNDIDLLVKFKSFDLANYFQNYIDLKEELKEIFNKEVDLVEEQTLKNPYLIKSINRNKKLIYG